MTQKIRVLIVDDSKLIRDVLTAILNEQPDIEVVGAAADAFQARDMLLDIEKFLSSGELNLLAQVAETARAPT